MAYEPVNIEVNGFSYQVLPATGINALDLDRFVFGLWSSINDFKDGDDFVKKFSTAFYRMEKDEFERLLSLTFRGVSYIGGDGEGNVILSNTNAIAEHFADHRGDMYTVMIEIWKANKLTPFA